MLILSRKPGEYIVIRAGNQTIWVGIHRVEDGHKVKLMINSPDDVEVDREEIYIRKMEEKKQNPQRRPKV